MATLETKIKAEQDVRKLLEDEGVEQPDRVEYGYGCIRLFWLEPKVVLIVDIDDHGNVGPGTAEYPNGPLDRLVSQADKDPFDPLDPSPHPPGKNVN